MLTLVEPFMFRSLLDTPYLGAATLLASCRQSGVEVSLMRGQTQWLKHMFVDDSDELWHLIMDIRPDDFEHVKIEPFQNHIRGMGESAFRDELLKLYHVTVTGRSPRDYFNAVSIDRLGMFINTFLTVYRFYIRHRDYLPRIWNRYIEDIVQMNPSYIGFSLHSRDSIISRAIRKRLRSASHLPMIAGGPITPFLNTEQLRGFFEDEEFDYVIIGEGDKALPELIRALENGSPMAGVPNLVYRNNGTIRYNESRAVLKLDELPFPDFSDFDLDRYLVPETILPVLTARGCPWGKCGFCSHYNIYQKRYRALSIDRFVEGLKHLHRIYGCTHFAIHDEDMPAPRARMLSRALSHLDQEFRFYSYARLSEGYDDPSLLSEMYGAGFRTLVWGMESGSQRVLDSMNKGTDSATMGRILKKSATHGISNICFVMFGFPGETREEAQATVSFLEQHAPYISDVSFSVFDLELASPIGRNPRQWGVTIYEDGGYTVDRGMSHDDALRFHRRLAKSVDFNITRITSDELKFVMPGHNKRMLRFLSASHGLISYEIALRALTDIKIEELYAIVIGDISTTNKGEALHPFDARESLSFNKQRPPAAIPLGALEAFVVRESDGTRSVSAILRDPSLVQSNGNVSDSIQNQCLSFLLSLLARGYAVVFSNPWRHRQA